MRLPLWLLKPWARILHRHFGLRIRLAELLQPGLKKQVSCYGYQARLDSTYLIDGIYLLLDEYDDVYENLCRTLLRPGDCVLDVGCNLGMTLFIASQATAGQARLFGWEPDPRQFQRCQTNLELNPELLPHVTLENCALSDSDGELSFHSVERANLLVDSSGALQFPCRSLDSLWRQHQWDRVNLIKIDTDGHEPAFFVGARETIAQFRPVLYFESLYLARYSTQVEPWAFLTQLGYRFFDARYPHAPLDPQRDCPLDTLACPRESWGELHPELSRRGARASRQRSTIRRLTDCLRYRD